METTMTDYYETLGVPPSAGPAAIKAVFRARTRAVHPDAPGGGDPAMMAALNEAYEVLSDPARRAAHDAELDAEAAAAARQAAPQPDPDPEPAPTVPSPEPVAEPVPVEVQVTARTALGGWAFIFSILAAMAAVIVFFVARRPEQPGAGDLIAMILLGLCWLSWWGRGGWKSPALAAVVGGVWYGLQHGQASPAWWGSAAVMAAAFCLLAVAKATTRGDDSR